ncbi:MAG: ABC transporter substrate-binding protein [Actinomycetota bacterium]
MIKLIRRAWAVLAVTLACWAPAAWAMGPEVVFATQPASLPDAALSESMRRDRVLKAGLAALGMRLVERPFAKGKDMVPLLDGNTLHCALLGDMPTMAAMLRHDAVAVGLLKQAFSSVIGHRIHSMAELKGRSIAYAPGSTAHYTLLQGLTAAGLREADVTLVPMDVSEMPGALAANRVSAFAAWEPAPTIALDQDRDALVVHRGLNTAYFVIAGPVRTEAPEVARLLAASFIRAVIHMRRTETNLHRVAGWAVAAAERFTGARSSLTPRQVAAIVHREVLDVPATPLLPPRIADPGQVLHREFQFLAERGLVDAGAEWSRVRRNFDYSLLVEVSGDAKRWRLDEFDYAED